MSVKNKKIFVTGAGGKIGSKLVLALRKSGYDVLTLKRPGVDILEVAKYKKEMRSCDYVYHLVAYQNVLDKKEDEFYRVNVKGTQAIMRALKGSRIKKFLYVSTVMVFDKNETKNFYVTSKREALKLVKKSDLPWVVVYPSIVVDLKEKMVWWRRLLTGGVPGGLMSRLGDRERWIKFIWIDDLIEEMVDLVKNSRVGKEYILEKEKVRAKDYMQLMRDRIRAIER